MGRKHLIGISIIAVVILIVASLTNVIGYQTVQTSQQNLIKERISQKELLFQSFVDITDNTDIQKEKTIRTTYLNYAEKNQILNIKIILGFILAVIMMISAVIAIPISLCINTLLKLGILPRLEGVLEYVFVFFFIVAFFCWAIIPDEFWDWLYTLFPFVFKSTLLEARGTTCIS